MHSPGWGEGPQPSAKQLFGYKDDYNLYIYTHDDPTDYVDPAGTYGRGTGWTDSEWRKFDRQQQEAANMDMEAVAVLSQAIADAGGTLTETDQKVLSTFESKFGAGTATMANLQKTADAFRKTGAMLYSREGSASKFTAQEWASAGDNGGPLNSGSLAAARDNSSLMFVNGNHPLFGDNGKMIWALGHEPMHGALNYHDQKVGGVTAYKFGNSAMQHAYSMLPSVSPDSALVNPDTLTDFAHQAGGLMP